MVACIQSESFDS